MSAHLPGAHTVGLLTAAALVAAAVVCLIRRSHQDALRYAIATGLAAVLMWWPSDNRMSGPSITPMSGEICRDAVILWARPQPSIVQNAMRLTTERSSATRADSGHMSIVQRSET
jgi:cyanate permease